MITNVIQKGKSVIVYVDGSQRAQINVSSTPGSGLKNWNSDNFSVQQGSSIMIYNEYGNLIDSHYTGAINFGAQTDRRDRKESRKASRKAPRTGIIGEFIDLVGMIVRWILFIVFLIIMLFVYSILS